MRDPHGKLVGVHPDLVKVLENTKGPLDFQIVYGPRTVQAQAEAVKTGHSQTMHSRHLPNQEGLCCAVDVAHVTDGGSIDWASGHEAAVYGAIAGQILASARELGIHVEWGGTWNETTDVQPGHFHDWGHFQLPWARYP